MKKEVIHTNTAPAAIGPYSQAGATGNFLFTSGQLGIDPQTGELAPGGIKEQARMALKNLVEVLKAGGASPESVVKTTCFLIDMKDFAAFNEVYAEFFNTAAHPARSCVAVAGLPKGGLVEIEAIALRS